MHWGDCYCCDCCCENLYPVTRDKRWDLMTPNRFLAVVDEEKCTGCEECVERCPFEAIEMKPGATPQGTEMRPSIPKSAKAAVSVSSPANQTR